MAGKILRYDGINRTRIPIKELMKLGIEIPKDCSLIKRNGEIVLIDPFSSNLPSEISKYEANGNGVNSPASLSPLFR